MGDLHSHQTNDPYFKEIQAKDVPTPLAFSLLAFVSMLLFGIKNK